MNQTQLEGSFVRHKARSEWGVGYVCSQSSGTIMILFENHDQTDPVPFKVSIVKKFIDLLDESELPSDCVLLTEEGRANLIAHRTEVKSSATTTRKRSRTAVTNGAIFTRLPLSYLTEALGEQAGEPTNEVTFRSQIEWVQAAKWRKNGHPTALYIASGEEPKVVTYTAQLGRVRIDPVESDPETQELLEKSLSITQDEGLREGDVKTLYTLTHLEKLETPFPMTHLIKQSDHKPISAAYSRSYCLVEAIEPTELT